MSFKENLKKYRIAAGYNQVKDFAENTLHMKYTTYLAYENRGSWPDEDTLIKICNVLNVTPNQLLDFEFKKDKQERIKELCEKCEIEINFEETENDINDDIVHVTYINNSRNDNLPHKLIIPMETFIAIIDEALSSSQYYAKMKSILIDAFERFESRPLQIRKEEALRRREIIKKRQKNMIKRIDELEKQNQELKQMELKLERMRLELEQQMTGLENLIADLSNKNDDSKNLHDKTSDSKNTP